MCGKRFFLVAALFVMFSGQSDAQVPASKDCKPCRKLTEARSELPASVKAANRCRVSGGCGSGSVCGWWNGGSLVMTNAHVTGTRVGRAVSMDFGIDGRTVTKEGRVIMAAYSDRTLTDWAVVFIPDWQEIKPIKLSKRKPSGTHHTTGSPRCVWPMRFSRLTTADVSDTSSLWRWRPNAIGGQSGSHVVSDADGLQYGLLTWSWGGLGAGQQTSEIFRQASQRSVSGEPRIDGLTELSPSNTVCENGFFAEASVTELPIWEDSISDGCDSPTPDGLSDAECALLAILRERSAAAGVDYEKTISILIGGEAEETNELRAFARLRDRARERNIDFVRLIELILEIISLFR